MKNTLQSLNHRQVDVNGISLHVVEAGLDRESTLLFLHGWPENWMAFKPIMRILNVGNFML